VILILIYLNVYICIFKYIMLNEELLGKTNLVKSVFDLVRNKTVLMNLKSIKPKGDCYYKSSLIKASNFISDLNEQISQYGRYNFHHIFIVSNTKQENLSNNHVSKVLYNLKKNNFASFNSYSIGLDMETDSSVMKDLVSFRVGIKCEAIDTSGLEDYLTRIFRDNSNSSAENIVLFTIDKSQAMEDKWESVIKAIEQFSLLLKGTDHIGCFVFNEGFVNVLEYKGSVHLEIEQNRRSLNRLHNELFCSLKGKEGFKFLGMENWGVFEWFIFVILFFFSIKVFLLVYAAIS
jgi:hypothetical protein